jgi:putative hydrolase of the HAD superfamily
MPAVIFDLDDTLYPHVRHVHSGFAAVATYVDRNFGVPAKDAYAALRRASEDGNRGCVFRMLCEVSRLDATVVPDLRREYHAHRPQLWLRHDASAALKTLRESGWRTALLTNGDPSVQAGKVRALEIEGMVDHIVYANEHAAGGKPAREPFLEVLRRLDVSPREAVMVGDDLIDDIGGAQALGIRTILLSLPGRPQRRVTLADENRLAGTCSAPGGADAVVHLLSDVPQIASALLGLEMGQAA